jgi:hypothetical protein
MNKTKFLLYFWFLVSVLTTPVYAENEPFVNRFLGSPLLVLAAMIAIDVAAFFVNKMRK